MQGFDPFREPDAGADALDGAGEFVPVHLPAPGPFLDGAAVLTGDAHVAVHRTAREVFAACGVRAGALGYNLAVLNRDRRYPDAGFRYAADAETLRAEFTPRAPACPRTAALARSALRAFRWHADRFDYGTVRLRVAPGHEDRDAINETLERVGGE